MIFFDYHIAYLTFFFAASNFGSNGSNGRWQLNEFDKRVWENFNYILYIPVGGINPLHI